VKIEEGEEPEHTDWHDNFFCSKSDKEDPGMRWSPAGPIPEMKCTQIKEDADKHTWQDNYLCVPEGSRFNFEWNADGPITGKECIKWEEGSDTDGTWLDNYLCM